jgi:hypothetical protein
VLFNNPIRILSVLTCLAFCLCCLFISTLKPAGPFTLSNKTTAPFFLAISSLLLNEVLRLASSSLIFFHLSLTTDKFAPANSGVANNVCQFLSSPFKISNIQCFESIVTYYSKDFLSL